MRLALLGGTISIAHKIIPVTAKDLSGSINPTLKVSVLLHTYLSSVYDAQAARQSTYEGTPSYTPSHEDSANYQRPALESQIIE